MASYQVSTLPYQRLLRGQWGFTRLIYGYPQMVSSRDSPAKRQRENRVLGAWCKAGICLGQLVDAVARSILPFFGVLKPLAGCWVGLTECALEAFDCTASSGLWSGSCLKVCAGLPPSSAQALCIEEDHGGCSSGDAGLSGGPSIKPSLQMNVHLLGFFVLLVLRIMVCNIALLSDGDETMRNLPQNHCTRTAKSCALDVGLESRRTCQSTSRRTRIASRTPLSSDGLGFWTMAAGPPTTRRCCSHLMVGSIRKAIIGA